jgi:AcrR family transcriptional regulator
MTTRQENALKTRQKLIDVTHELIKEKGFYKLSITDITQKAGVAVGTFYVYFKHKEEIVLDICKGLFQQTQLKLDENKNLSITERLCLYFKCFVEEIQGYKIHIVREWIKGVIEENSHSEDMGSIKWQYDFEMLKNIISEAVKNNELKPETPIDTLTNIILCQVYGMFTVWCMTNGAFEPEKWVQTFCDTELKPMLQPYLREE